MIVVHGLKSCDGCRRAVAWLRAQGIRYRFHDLRSDGLDADRLAVWLEELGHEALVTAAAPPGVPWRRSDAPAWMRPSRGR